MLKKTKIIHIFATLTILLGLFFAGSKGILAQSPSITEISQEEEKLQRQYEELQKKAEAYQKIIELKQKQGATLTNQVETMNAEIGRIETNIAINEDKIKGLSGQIEDLKNKIKEKEESVVAQKKVLSELLRTYYEYDRQGVFSTITDNNDSLQFMPEKDRLDQIGDKVQEMLSSVKALKKGLENEKKSIESKLTEITGLKIDLEEKNQELEASKVQKNTLLVQTQGDEARYQARLQKVEKQKLELLGDIDELYAANSTEIEAVVEKAPSKYWASTGWYYSQKDSRWGNTRIGQSKSLMKDYGCAITDVAMVFTYYGQTISPKSMAKQPIYSWDLINWPMSWSGGIELDTKYGKSHGNISWSVIDKEIKNDNPVIVFIKARGGAGHYVVIHTKTDDGKYVVHDPYFGSNIYLDSTMRALGKMYGTTVTKSKIDQMIIYKK